MTRKATSDPLASLVHLKELIDNGGQISIGKLPPISCVAVASDEHNCLAMLRRQKDESLYQLLARLDHAIARAWHDDFFTDEINSR